MLSSILEPTHLLIILIVALVFLGPKGLPEAARALGQGLREFRTSVSPGHDVEYQPTASVDGAGDEGPQAADQPR